MDNFNMILDRETVEGGGRETIVYAPGDELRGDVMWTFERQPESVQVRLYWRTQGKGTTDVKIVDEVSFNQPDRAEARSFSFTLPFAPYSMSGRLISIVWGIEALAFPNKEVETKEFTLSPVGAEVQLSAIGTTEEV